MWPTERLMSGKEKVQTILLYDYNLDDSSQMSNGYFKHVNMSHNFSFPIMTLTSFLISCKSSATLSESDQVTKKMGNLSDVRKKLVILGRSLKTRNECMDGNSSTTSTSTCRSLSSKEVTLEESQSVRFGHVEIREYGRVLVENRNVEMVLD